MRPEVLADCARQALARLESCKICPRHCGVNRLQDEHGFCRSGRKARVAGFSPHFGEEMPLVGCGGSGTIFFCGCSLACVFCQNYDTSQEDRGEEVTPEILARMMLRLQDCGCHNINFVTPTHVIPQILEALVLARGKGLNVPLVYNSGGYDSVETLRLIDGIFDIYMPDAKFGSNDAAFRYSLDPDYVDIMKAAIREMHRQVGDLEMGEEGIARRGLLVRHLVLPEGAAGTAEVVRFLSQEVSGNTLPEHHGSVQARIKSLPLSRPRQRITLKEYSDAMDLAVRAGLVRGLEIF